MSDDPHTSTTTTASSCLSSSNNNDEKDSSFLQEYFARIPKVELHAHLNGCIREETLFQLAAQRHVKLSDHHFRHHRTSSFKNRNDGLLYNVRPRSLHDCFAMFCQIPLAVNDIPALQRITREALHDFANVDACAYVELRSTPKRLLLRNHLENDDGDPQEPAVLMDKRTYIETILQVMRDFEQEEEERYQRAVLVASVASGTTTTSNSLIRLPMTCRLIVAVDRSQSLREATENIDLAIEFFNNNNNNNNHHCTQAADASPPRVVGVDLGGNPTRQEFQTFAPLFAKARSAGLKVTLHCGEVPCNIDKDSERYDEAVAVLDFKPDRLGHAMLLPPDLQARIVQEKIPVETCPTSNIMTLELTKKNSNIVQNVDDSNENCGDGVDGEEVNGSSHSNNDHGNLIAGLRHHPTLQRWLQHDKHPLCISTDDPGVFCTSLTQELLLVAKTFSIIPKEDLAQLVVDSMQHAFCDSETKNWIQKRMQQQLDQLHAHMQQQQQI
jgi:adenosine deaminase